MIVKTKKYQLDKNTYIGLAFKNVMIEWWWAWLVPVAIMLIPIFYAPAFGWCLGITITVIILYILFWLVQFAGVTQLEQNKVLFERLTYEIDSRQIMMKLNAKQGMPITWDKIQGAKKTKKAFLLVLSKAQFIHLPFTILRSENDIRFLETILKRKNLLK
ncbi:YcxB family protein [Flammeovirgaceae bacterium SG7u.111]|nr:YcxB family protein [Flammeovirgaceae bacterium SG7u.132]WPO36221.1 YcxB family protein [Flammeovirgaceae bacterium SG7u.111]